MSLLQHFGWRHALIAMAVLFLFALKLFSHEPEIALVIGEPYEDMRQRSSASIGPAIPGRIWFSTPKSDARLNFNDPNYGFVTPLARFFTVMFNKGQIDGVRLSPQIEPLLLNDALKLVLDLQDQWHRKGWVTTRPEDFPPFADTRSWREHLRQKRSGGTTYWQAGNQYQIMLDVNRFTDPRHPDEERYLISLAIAKPWVKPWEGYSAPVAP